MRAINIRCYGKVQGVFFRVSTKTQADELGVTGWVRNESDGSVLIHAEGEAERLYNLVAWSKKGPQFAKVSSVEQEESTAEGFDSFEIRHS
ncbi:MAG: acylphosphatase [Cyclobacteriaceae bacterium]